MVEPTHEGEQQEMTRRTLVMAVLAGLPRLLKWVRREAEFQKIRAAVHAGIGTLPRPTQDEKEN